ncbi:DUF6082 family protein [Streptomyces sp. 029-5]|uniref:DUF6082 family protein n=1 Tax=Streptomyces sp. 029-5 TaxID=2789261 RepID=UPI00398120EF
MKEVTVSSRLVATALITVAGIGATGVAVTYATYRDHLVKSTVDIHLTLLRDQMDNPALSTMWAGWGDTSESERSLLVHRNSWMVFWSLQYRFRVVPAHALRDVARVFMDHPGNAKFWERSRHTRIRQMRDRVDRRFFKIFEEAYGARYRDPLDSHDLVGAGA